MNALLLALALSHPNIVVLMADDLGYHDVGFQGCTDIPTPNIDSIARDGVRFTNAYVAATYCSPSRAGFFTGRYPTRFGHEFNLHGVPGFGMPLSESTIADRLRTAGYATGLVGKWHLGDDPQFQPQQRGFDEFFGFLRMQPYIFDGTPVMRGVKPTIEREYLIDACARESVSFIDQHAQKPFFLCVTFQSPHGPIQPDENRLARLASITEARRRDYAALILSMDDAVGRILAALSANSLAENTIVVFFNDNGGAYYFASNAPLRGRKTTTLEGGIRVPMAICWPGHIKAGTVYNRPIVQLDLPATFVAAAGMPAVENADGVDLLPYLDGRNAEAPHDALFWRKGPQMAVRCGDWKLVRYDIAIDTGLNRGNEDATDVTESRLYDLACDVGESHDLASANPAKVAELQSLWDEWNANNVAPIWPGQR